MSKLAYDVPDVEAQTFDGSPLPSLSEGWSQKRHPDLQTVGCRRVRLDNGKTRKYYKQIVKPDAVQKLREKSQALLKEIAADDTRALVNRERKLIKGQPRKRKPRRRQK
jgi:hypothetical protein